MKLTPHVYTSEQEKQRDNVIGAVGWVVVNVVLAGLYVASPALVMQIAGQTNQGELVYTVITLLGLLPWVVNLGGFIFFGVFRPQIAAGALKAFLVVVAILFILVLLAGIVVFVICFLPRR